MKVWQEVYIGLGSNLSDPKMQVLKALDSLKDLPNTQWVSHSSLYSSRPQGPQDQPDFVNAVALLKTQLSPIELLDRLQAFETSQGKVKKRHWGERLIDLDILLYGHETLHTERLIIPHPFMIERDFVLLPMAEISPDLILPNHSRIKDLISELPEGFIMTDRKVEKS
ncbi:2-amino-4-hydroxy-6-hydroxymethyldihydropteridine diphosphokinase [Hydrogenovibrio sp. 3SP14C1]|uniref:2-amino-4-hydroxy-6- hydroxymethyldihydropteridine diphosphokinase n=1 Tax=Hydrogenovibrio sp. 3SP14C1 TaxID=3038774 RepID=UPI0024169E02|nr:2-amino-4-hydroxy-6-hydroxymethyldihydropteridine diphosphokinase [Hydrogenovibrio sp. 3SP14C1]MDG4813372.1 2-amino-4-hydroxy-6-hydroxymethyldihydropteridine diphosphokinase [Hydrogenovibrio sp. 3SP14C1]